MNLKEEIKQAENDNYEKFDAMMNSLFELAYEFQERDELTENEANFLEAFDKYVESACDLTDLEDELEDTK